MNTAVWRRRGVVAAVAAAGLLALSACSGSSGGSAGVSAGDYSGPKVTVTFWNGWTGGAAPQIVPKLISEFNASHKNIVVKDVPMEWADISAKMPLAVKAGKGPDLSVAHEDGISTYAAEGLLLNANDIVKKLGYKASDFPPGALEGTKYNGGQYGIPWSITPIGLLINKDVLKKAGIDPNSTPQNSTDYLANLDKLKAAGVPGEWVDGYFFTGVFEFESILWQNGGELFNKDTSKATFNSDAGVKALTWMVDLMKKGYSPTNVAQDGNINAFIAGKTAYNWNGVWQTTNPAIGNVDWTSAQVPQIGDTKKAVWANTTQWIFLHNKNQDKNKTAAAATFASWMLDHSAGWAATGELPAKNTIRDDPALVEKYPMLKAFIDELPYAHYEATAPGIEAVEATINTAVNDAIIGGKDPKQALDEQAAKADKLLEQNKQEYRG